MRRPHLFLALLALLPLPGTLVAYELDPQANFNIVITEPTYAGCDRLQDSDFPSCEDLVTGGSDDACFVWVFVNRVGEFDSIEGLGAVQFGITYDETINVLQWSMCTAGLEIPQNDPEGEWPESGTGNAVTWNMGCYFPPGECAKVGYFTVGSGSLGSMAITPDPRIGTVLYATGLPESGCGDDVESFEVCLPNLGHVDIATGASPICGDNCSTLTREVTWGGIKSHYR